VKAAHMLAYHASAGDISKLSIKKLLLRMTAWNEAYKNEQKFEAAIAGAKLK